MKMQHMFRSIVAVVVLTVALAVPTASAVEEGTKAKATSIEAEAQQQQGAQLDESDFVRLAAGINVKSGTKSDDMSVLLQTAHPKVADNEASQLLLKKYNITIEQFQQEYNRRMFSKDHEFNSILYDKILAEMKLIIDAQ